MALSKILNDKFWNKELVTNLSPFEQVEVTMTGRIPPSMSLHLPDRFLKTQSRRGDRD